MPMTGWTPKMPWAPDIIPPTPGETVDVIGNVPAPVKSGPAPIQAPKGPIKPY